MRAGMIILLIALIVGIGIFIYKTIIGADKWSSDEYDDEDDIQTTSEEPASAS